MTQKNNTNINFRMYIICGLYSFFTTGILMFLTYGIDDMLFKEISNLSFHISSVTNYILGFSGMSSKDIHKTTTLLLLILSEGFWFFWLLRIKAENSSSKLGHKKYEQKLLKILGAFLCVAAFYPYGFMHLQANGNISSESLLHQAMAFAIIISILILKFLSTIPIYKYHNSIVVYSK